MAEDRTHEYVELLAGNQRRLYAYIRPQVASPTDADDVLPQTSKVLWTKFDQYQPGSNFLTWACRVARLEVLTHHRDRKRQPAFLSDQTAEVLADELIEMVDDIDDRDCAATTTAARPRCRRPGCQGRGAFPGRCRR